ncbi:twin transmembrane helix small protein [Inquilinus sp. CAU 1745]|uniref:twin transmembrane helix small protein n=1 Tax=Inquilinus sp. CAU 1745 TaxID=3140369 RepID=UPI00325ADB2F
MSTVFLILAILSMIGVVASLGIGMVGMARNGEFNAKYGNTMMRWRIILQGVAILFFALALWTRGG